MSRWGLVSSVDCRKVPAGPVQVTACWRCSSARILLHGCPAVFSVTRMSSRASQHNDVGADPVPAAVIDRAQVQDLLHVAPAPLDFQELLVAQRDVLGGQVRVAGAQEVLAVEVRLRLGLGLVHAEQAGGGDAQEPLQAGFAGQGPLDPGTLGLAQRVRAGDGFFELGDQPCADRGVAFGLVRVEADDEPVAVVPRRTSLTCRLSRTVL